MRQKSFYWLFLVGSLLLSTACSKSDSTPTPDVPLTLSSESVTIPVGATTAPVTITAPGAWTATVPSQHAEWLSVSPSSGNGNGTVTLTIKPMTDRIVRKSTLTVKLTDNTNISVQAAVVQQVENAAPTAPVLDAPGVGATKVLLTQAFSWELSTDPDGDKVSYELSYSTDNKTWTTVKDINGTGYNSIPSFLKANTTYQWKVTAKDEFGGATPSAIRSFSTVATAGAWQDNEVRIYQENTNGKKPYNLVILGDGYTAAECGPGGAFEAAAIRAAEAMLTVEPIATYRSWIKTQIICTYSNESGVSVRTSGGGATLVNLDTRWRVIRDDGTSTYIGLKGGSTEFTTRVFPYVVANAENVPASELPHTTVIIVVNDSKYCGTCYTWSDECNAGLMPLNATTGTSSSGIYTQFENVVVHECAGHGMGHLADEYTRAGTLTESAKQQILSNQSVLASNGENMGWYCNLSVVNEKTQSPWAYVFNSSWYNKQYQNVGLYEGGKSAQYGVWRPEQNSCMNNNVLYFNAPSRVSIVRRIMRAAQVAFNFDEFAKTDYAATRVTKTTPFPVVPFNTDELLPEPVECAGAPSKEL